MSFQSETPLGTEIKNGTTDTTIGDADNVAFERSGYASPFKITWLNFKSILNGLYLRAANNLSDLSNIFTSRNNLGLYEMFITTGDQTTSSNVATNITGLVTGTLEANKRYYFEGIIRIGCNNTGGVKIQVTIPTGASVSFNSEGATTSLTGRTFTNLLNSATLSGVAYGLVNSQAYYIKIAGEISMGSTTGTVQFGGASSTNGQTSTFIQLGTCINYKKLN